MPLGSVNESYSPYQGTSAFAGNFLLISLEKLIDDDLLDKSDLEELKLESHEIDYDKAKQIKIPLLRKAYYNYYVKGDLTDYHRFCEENNYWLEDYALFMAINEYIIEIASMLSNFVLEFLYTRFIVYRKTCDTLTEKKK